MFAINLFQDVVKAGCSLIIRLPSLPRVPASWNQLSTKIISCPANVKCMQWSILQNVSGPERVYNIWKILLPKGVVHSSSIYVPCQCWKHYACNCLFDTNSYLLGPSLRVSMVIKSRRKFLYIIIDWSSISHLEFSGGDVESCWWTTETDPSLVNDNLGAT